MFHRRAECRMLMVICLAALCLLAGCSPPTPDLEAHATLIAGSIFATQTAAPPPATVPPPPDTATPTATLNPRQQGFTLHRHRSHQPRICKMRCSKE